VNECNLILYFCISTVLLTTLKNLPISKTEKIVRFILRHPVYVVTACHSTDIHTHDFNDCYSLWVDWVLRLANSERHWNCTAHFWYHGSIEYCDTWDGIVIVAPVSGIAQHYSLVTADERHLSLLVLINVPVASRPLPQPCQHVRGLPSRVYCVGGHTDIKATEAGAVGGFRFHKCPQEMRGWQMLPLADADPQKFLRLTDWCSSRKFADVDGHGSSF